MEDSWNVGLEEAITGSERITELLERSRPVLWAEIPSSLHSQALSSLRMIAEPVPRAAATEDSSLFHPERILSLLLFGLEYGFTIGWYLRKVLTGDGGENLAAVTDKATGEPQFISQGRRQGVKHEYDVDFLSICGNPDIQRYLTMLATVRSREAIMLQTRIMTASEAGFVLGYITRRTADGRAGRL